MIKNNETNNMLPTFCFTCVLTCFLVVATLLVYFLVPSDSDAIKPEQIATLEESATEAETEISSTFQDYFSEIKLDGNTDEGLVLYRQPSSKAAVEWFYYNITQDANVTQAILTEADKNNIPLSLAFSLAHTESNYKTDAINSNANSSIDRGLFQLNDKSFPKLTEDDFFDPYVSAKYGMSHLKFCLDTAGNEVSALAMYNAGTNRVRSNKTPQTTLNYVGKIVAYQKTLDQFFSEQVVAYYDNQFNDSISVALINTKY